MNVRKFLRSFICWVILFSIPAVSNGGDDFTNELKNFDEAKNPIPVEFLQNVYKKSKTFLPTRYNVQYFVQIWSQS